MSDQEDSELDDDSLDPDGTDPDEGEVETEEEAEATDESASSPAAAATEPLTAAPLSPVEEGYRRLTAEARAEVEAIRASAHSLGYDRMFLEAEVEDLPHLAEVFERREAAKAAKVAARDRLKADYPSMIAEEGKGSGVGYTPPPGDAA